MAEYNDFAEAFPASNFPSDSMDAPKFDDYGMFSSTNGAEPEDNIFATEQAQVYDSSSAGYGAFDTPVETPAYSQPISLEPESEDPRMAWYRKNSEVLALKDQKEREAKGAIINTAQQHLTKMYQDRKEALEAKRSANRDSEVEQAGSLPTGNTPWERVTSLINFSFDAHAQDVSRYKNVLITCRTNNVPVKGLVEKAEEAPVAELM